jgi:glycosyltransferase involved in cell wall biosynthesis
MRILYVIHQFYPESSSGTERFLLNLACSMQRSGHHVDIVTYSFAERSEFHRSGSLLTKQYQYKGISITAVRHDKVGMNLSTSVEDSSILSFARGVLGAQSGGYDWIHIVHPMRLTSFAISAMEAGIPYVLTLTDFWMICPKINLRTSFDTQCSGPEGGVICSQWCPELRPEFVKSRLKAAREILHGAKAIVAPSHFVVAMFKKEFPELSASVIPHGLALDEFSRDSKTPETRGRIVFAYCGGLSAHKGVHILIAAFRSLDAHNAELRIYGSSSPQEQEYERMLRSMADQDDRIEFCGTYQEGEVGYIFQGIDVLIIPSICYETYSFALHEALASGVPVIVSAIACLDEKIEDSVNGWTFRVGDAADLTSKLKVAISNPQILETMKQRVTKEDVQRIEEEAYLYERIYGTIRTLGQQVNQKLAK